MDGQLRSADLMVLLLYMGGIFGLGCWLARRSQKTQEFMAAGRSLPGWAVGLSIFGTYVSSIGFLGNTGKAYGVTTTAVTCWQHQQAPQLPCQRLQCYIKLMMQLRSDGASELPDGTNR